MEWQPIETAPKDGAEFLIFTNGGAMIVVNQPPGCALGHWSRRKSGRSTGEWSGMAIFVNPTHWMPLPEPPK